MRDKSPTRKKLHQAALALFSSQGVAETSVRDLAQAAGIAEGTLYRHYPSKDALVKDLFLSNYRQFGQDLRQGQTELGSTSPLLSRLCAITAQVYGLHDSDPALFRFLLLVQHTALPEMEDGTDNPVCLLESLIAEAIERKEIPMQDIGLACSMVMGIILQPATAVLYGRLTGPLSPRGDHISRACLGALMAPQML